MGADLTSYGRTRSATAIERAIVNPDADPQSTGEVVEVRTQSGDRISGVVRNEDNLRVTIQSLDGRYHFLERSHLASVNYTHHSLMPGNYGARLSASEVKDLVAFLIETGKGAPAAEAPVEVRRRDH